MTTAIDQEQRLLSVETPLGDDVLILQSFTAAETLSSLFSYQLEMLSSNDAIAPADIVSQNITVRLNLADGSQRFFNGYVSQFIGGALHARELRRYRAEVVPWLWFLTRSTDCRIFQFKSAPQIIELVFQNLGFSDFEMDLQGSHPERVYCVQYRETAFDFVSRLMEEEGMFYWFRQEDGSHTLVIADHKGAYTDCPENEIECHPGSLTPDHISQWEHHYEFRSGKYAQTDYNFETPSTSLRTSTNSLIELPEIGNYELYDYPGGYQITDDGENLTRIRMEEDEVSHDVVRCISGCRSLHPGGKFTLTRHECSSEQDKSYVITRIQHSANDQTQLAGGGGETYYENSFECIPDVVVFRPERITPKPKIRGPQTAVVVGPAGEEIYPDEYGRVKAQFHWDREGQNDENSSCWIRVSQVHAGKGFGGIDIPRIGEEVIVDFLEGDPDRPIVTGRVYNAEQTPPFPLPAGGMVSGMKSNTTPGGGGSNENSMDDSKGNEKLTVHAQKNMATTVENDLSTTVVSGNDSLTVKAGTQSVTVKGETSLVVEAGDRVVDVTGNYKLDTTSEINVKAPSKITLTCGSSSITVEPGKITLAAGDGSKVTLDANALTESSQGSKVLLDGKAKMSSDGEATVEAPIASLSGGKGASVVKNDASGVAATAAKISLNG